MIRLKDLYCQPHQIWSDIRKTTLIHIPNSVVADEIINNWTEYTINVFPFYQTRISVNMGNEGIIDLFFNSDGEKVFWMYGEFNPKFTGWAAETTIQDLRFANLFDNKPISNCNMVTISKNVIRRALPSDQKGYSISIKQIKDSIFWIIAIFEHIKHIKLNQPELVEKTIVQNAKGKQKTKTKKKPPAPTRISFKKYTLVGDEKRRKKPSNVVYQKAEWGVRGHYRIYKSGKRVWVAPHTCKRNKEIAKGMTLQKYDDEYVVQ